VVSTCIFTFGTLLLLGGRIGDLWGRHRALQPGIGVFVVASLAGDVHEVGIVQVPDQLGHVRRQLGSGGTERGQGAVVDLSVNRDAGGGAVDPQGEVHGGRSPFPGVGSPKAKRPWKMGWKRRLFGLAGPRRHRLARRHRLR
jgi:hypothetical protein